MRPSWGLVVPLGVLVMTGCALHELRKFPDRPVAWHEHDDADVPRAPRQKRSFDTTWLFRDSVVRGVDRALAFEAPRPAEDVNALDEVPCSTWFCPRNHLRRLAPGAVAAGPPGVSRPLLPLTVVEGKDAGASPGFVALDARGVKYLLKFDPVGYLGLATGAEAVGSRLVWAAGWNVPGAFVIELRDEDIGIRPGTTYLRRGVAREEFTHIVLAAMLARVARYPDGMVRAVAVPYLGGKILGDTDLQGRRADDPNDRIPHERRRSLRASRVVMAWLNVADAGEINTLATWDSAPGAGAGDRRRYVRHYLIDFGGGLGSWTTRAKGLRQGNEATFAPTRVLAALVTLGLYRRDWQEQREAIDDTRLDPAIGWLPAEGWDPAAFRTTRPALAFLQMTDRDAYWGAKVVTSFTDAQLSAAVTAGKYAPAAGRALLHALIVRRDLIGTRWLRTMTAIERPAVTRDGATLCFMDLAIVRGYARSSEVKYSYRVSDDLGNTLARGATAARGTRTCLDWPAANQRGAARYRVARIEARVGGQRARGAAVHLAWRPREQRWVVVGLERDE